MNWFMKKCEVFEVVQYFNDGWLRIRVGNMLLTDPDPRNSAAWQMFLRLERIRIRAGLMLMTDPDP